MRFLLEKDLRILRRSPLLVVLLVAYPVLIAVLVGLALSGGPDKPRVAVFSQLPEDSGTVNVAGTTVDPGRYADELYKAVDPIKVRSRAEAERLVRDGEALAAVIVPADLVDRIQSAVSLSGSSKRPTVEVLYNAEDPVKQQYVESTIESRVADLNRAVSEKLTSIATGYLGILLRGGDFSLFGQKFEVLGLQRSKALVDGVAAGEREGSPERQALERVSKFAQLAIDNLDLSDDVLDAVGEPVVVKRTVVEGRRTPLDAFAVAVAVTLSLMLVTVLLAAGMLALEREEHAFARLVRGLVSKTGLVAEKVVLAAVCALAATLLMTAGVSIFVSLDWGRAPLWVVALAFGGLAFGALGVAIGAAAREVRAASLLAILLALPIAFLALVPSGAVASGLYDVIRVVSACFPFRPALDAVDAAINDAGGLGTALLHLALLTVAWGAVARIGLRRFA
ncbi:MAG: ABC transporter permease [Solirubrobacterales bacterium]|nr:ABC transporter permease [Solirubrobacterales bacterium]